ncbi:polysaccharide deacetylase family protein, partial [Salmonella enterica subsp. enterica serovar Enteritidis]|nr:polysaccharide deacetylase family protein [Salmonella enterica subsp. enterica serovar Enteritidis]
MLRWSEVREMHLSGLVEFHSHTHTHPRCDQKPDSRNPTEINRLQNQLTRNTITKKITN